MERDSLRDEAKRIVREKWKLDPDKPGWKGLVEAEIDDLIRQLGSTQRSTNQKEGKT